MMLFQQPPKPNEPSRGGYMDALRRVEVTPPEDFSPVDVCIATVSSKGYAPALDMMLTTLERNGGITPNAATVVVVFVVDGDPDSIEVATRHRAVVMPCHALQPVGLTVKSVLYSVPRFVAANRYLCLDADMLILQTLKWVVDAVLAIEPHKVLIARDLLYPPTKPLGEWMEHIYGGTLDDFPRLMACQWNVEPVQAGARVMASTLAINDGLFAGTAKGLLQAEEFCRNLYRWDSTWVDNHRFRNQIAYNMGLALWGAAVELDPVFNVQMHACQTTPEERAQYGFSNNDMVLTDGGALWNGRRAHVLHYTAQTKDLQAVHYARLMEL